MADATHRDEFDRLLIELADQHNAQPGTWLNHAPGRALARSSRVRRLVRRVRDHGQDRRDVRGATSMSACIVRGHTASPLNTIYRETRAMEQVPVVVAVTTNVPVPTVALRAMRDILMHTIVATLGIELPSPDLVRDPVRAELESHQ